jgi:3-phosphoshikimate 1-carboxyvinyltransferase
MNNLDLKQQIMEQIIQPSNRVNGVIKIPSSKSCGQRAYAAAMLVDGLTTIYNFGFSDDENAALEIIRQAGASVQIISNHELRITGAKISQTKMSINYGESGLSARMFTPLLAVNSSFIEMQGKGSILSRPMLFFDTIMKELGVDFKSTNGYLPFEMNGPLVPKNCTIDGSISSQFITGLIYSFVASPLTKNEQITILNPTSVPYLLLTLEMLRRFGVDVVLKENVLYFNGPYTFKSATISIEGDWSSASFLLVAGAISGTVKVENLKRNSQQADKKLMHALVDFGAIISYHNSTVTVTNSKNNAFTFDATHCPDLFPPLAVLAMFANGTSKITGVKRLLHKESNRSIALQEELRKMGATINCIDDDMFITGIVKSIGATVNPHGDHRIAMACAIAALRADGPVTIQNPQVINKSYPLFFEHLQEIQNN